MGIWRGWDLARSRSRSGEKVKAGLVLNLDACSASTALGTLFVTIFGVASSQIESRRGVAGSAW